MKKTSRLTHPPPQEKNSDNFSKLATTAHYRQRILLIMSGIDLIFIKISWANNCHVSLEGIFFKGGLGKNLL
ncbi:hypothetical protein [Serratia odorifera]|uniref:hypothetical protein n=1 Tax=Serratia odorifera TaxID=618 RepID=UPI0018E84326|nr:hypothetical protein [Serratia odorifera]MBJ2066797.1 hypothetical protein [Serratia odorifera]